VSGRRRFPSPPARITAQGCERFMALHFSGEIADEMQFTFPFQSTESLQD
jgi:hypothetical protein